MIKKIAGVSVNLECLPTKQDLIKSALQTKDYYRLDKEEALALIKKEITDSGIYRKLPKNTPAKDKPVANPDNGERTDNPE